MEVVDDANDETNCKTMPNNSSSFAEAFPQLNKVSCCSPLKIIRYSRLMKTKPLIGLVMYPNPIELSGDKNSKSLKSFNNNCIRFIENKPTTRFKTKTLRKSNQKMTNIETLLPSNQNNDNYQTIIMRMKNNNYHHSASHKKRPATKFINKQESKQNKQRPNSFSSNNLLPPEINYSKRIISNQCKGRDKFVFNSSLCLLFIITQLIIAHLNKQHCLVNSTSFEGPSPKIITLEESGISNSKRSSINISGKFYKTQ